MFSGAGNLLSPFFIFRFSLGESSQRSPCWGEDRSWWQSLGSWCRISEVFRFITVSHWELHYSFTGSFISIFQDHYIFKLWYLHTPHTTGIRSRKTRSDLPKISFNQFHISSQTACDSSENITGWQKGPIKEWSIGIRIRAAGLKRVDESSYYRRNSVYRMTSGAHNIYDLSNGKAFVGSHLSGRKWHPVRGEPTSAEC